MTWDQDMKDQLDEAQEEVAALRAENNHLRQRLEEVRVMVANYQGDINSYFIKAFMDEQKLKKDISS